MSMSVPLKVITPSLLPSPAVKLSPVVPARLSRPLLALNVTRRMPAPASTSEMLIRLPLPLLKTRLAS